MRHSLATDLGPKPSVRPARPDDLNALLELENQVFAADRMSRRSLRRLLASQTAATIVAEYEGQVAGYALLVFRPNSTVARLYSLAVDPDLSGRGIGAALLAAAEDLAWRRERLSLRLEVHVRNAAAIALYRKCGFHEFGRKPCYYEDGGDALRFEKPLYKRVPASRMAPYFHQTTEFTCGPACVMMALAWADRSFRPDPILELQLWREATTIFMHRGHGGCEPYGLAVALARRGLKPEIHVSRPGPYFLNSVSRADQRRVMRLCQEEFRRRADEIGIPTHLTPVTESVLMQALDEGAAAIILISGYRMRRKGEPHWIFVYGRDGRHLLVHDPAAVRDEHGSAASAETYAVPWSALERMMRCGPAGLRAALIVRKRTTQ